MNRSKSTLRKNKIMTVETHHFDKGTEMPFKLQDRWVAGATGFEDIQDAFRHLECAKLVVGSSRFPRSTILTNTVCHAVEPGDREAFADWH